MIRKVLILFLIVSYVVSDSCVRYTFEENFDEWLTHEWGACTRTSMPFWVVGKYSDLNLTGQNELSSSFISPLPSSSALPEVSCVSSFVFTMNLGGKIEVNIYMEPTDLNDQVLVIANLLGTIGGDRVTGLEMNFASDPSFVRGWHTLKMTLTGSETYDGYISIMGMASQNSIVLVDSFRYIPAGMDESACRLYEDEPAPTVPPTLEPTTPDPITPEEPTPDPIKPEEPTPDPITPDETTPDPITPDETTPHPIKPEEPTPDPITPEKTTPDPIKPEEPTPDPITPDETTPDPITPDETTPDPIKPEEPTPDPITPDETTPDPIMPDETTPNPITPEEITPDPITPEETTPDPTTPEVTTPDLTMPEVTTPDPTPPEVTTPDLTTPVETTPDPITPEEPTPDPIKPEEPTPDLITPDETTPEETTPENKHRYLLTIETWVKTQLSLSGKTM